MEKIKYIVTDLNGTLVDAMPTYTKIFCDVLKRRAGIESPEVTAYSVASTGTPWDEQFAHVLAEHNKDTQEAPQLMGEFCELVGRETYRLYPQVEDLLKSFKRKGCKIFITSGSGTGAMIKRIYEMGIYSYIDFLLGYDVYKKSPKHIEMLAEVEGLPLAEFAKQAIYFGDGPGDMEIAKECGLFAVGVAQTVSAEKLKAAGADIVLDKIGGALELDLDNLIADNG